VSNANRTSDQIRGNSVERIVDNDEISFRTQATEPFSGASGPSGTHHEKFCRGCSRWLKGEEFSLKDSARMWLRSRCRACCRARSQKHYRRMKPAYIQRNRRRKPALSESAAAFVLSFLADHACALCGEEDPIVLEFNHLDLATKSGNISEMIQAGTSVRRLRLEIAKCEVLCANCHQRHTISTARAHYKLALSTRAPSWRLAANRRNASIALERLAAATCLDCRLADSLVLQFDHRPDEIKVKDIGWFISSGSALRHVIAEMAKCDVRCANCHRRRTATERGLFRALANA
jgi:hypothetical protein